MGTLVHDRKKGDPDTAGVEADTVAKGTGHASSLPAAASAGQHAGQEPGIEGSGVRPN